MDINYIQLHEVFLRSKGDGFNIKVENNADFINKVKAFKTLFGINPTINVELIEIEPDGYLFPLNYEDTKKTRTIKVGTKHLTSNTKKRLSIEGQC